MIEREPFPWKKAGLWLLLISSALVTVYILFIGIVSIWTGLSHLDRDGFWMPFLTGAIAIILVLWFFFRLLRYIMSRMKGRDIAEL